MIEEKCANCNFYVLSQSECRRYAPRWLAPPGQYNTDFWPVIQGHEWCGEWELDKRASDEGPK